MSEVSIIQILDDDVKRGVSSKTGKPWSQARVGLSNGESTFMFNPVEIGQVVESYKDGEYTNWRVKRPDPKHDEIMAALRKIYSAITGDPEVVPEKETSKPKEIVDKVYPVDEQEPVDLKDIPFN